MSINELISLGMKQPEMPDTEANRLKKMLMAAQIGKAWGEASLANKGLELKKEESNLKKEEEARKKYEFERRKEFEPIARMETAKKVLDEFAPSLTIDKHDAFADWFNNQPAFQGTFKVPSTRDIAGKAMESGMQDLPSFYEQYKRNSLISLDKQLAQAKAIKEATFHAAQGSVVVPPGGTPYQVPSTKETTPLSDIGKLQADRVMLIKIGYDENSTVIKAIDDEIKKKSTNKEPEMSAEQRLAERALEEKLGRKPTAMEIDRHIQDKKLELTKSWGEERAAAYAKFRPMPVIDTKDNNKLTMATAAEIATDPSRYLPAAQGGKNLTQTALMEDIKGNITNARNSINKLKGDFTAAQAAQIAFVLGGKDPATAFDSMMRSTIGKTLTPDQIDYITDMAQLVENSMAMRSVLGAGQGSDMLRQAIKQTIPSATTPSKQFALVQLDKFEQVLNRLERGIPGVQLKEPKGKLTTEDDGLQKGGNLRDRAIAELKKRGKKVDENTISQAMKLLGGK